MFATREEARQFALAGNARLTLVSRATGTRFTYRVRRPEEGKPWFVQVLTGPDNESSYTFFGTIFADGAFRHSPRASIRPEAPSAGAFTWFWQVLAKDGPLPAGIEVHHEGRCGRCGRALTVPESIESGFGPECAGRAK
jgi:hypothetical protein